MHTNIGKLTNCPVSREIEILLLRAQEKNTKLIGGRNCREHKYNRCFSLIGTENFFSHFRYRNYDDNLQTQKPKTLTIKGNDIVRLQHGQFLNDTIIDYGIWKDIHHNNQSIHPLST